MMTYEAHYEFPLGSENIVRSFVLADNEEQARVHSGVSHNPTLTVRLVEMLLTAKQKKDKERFEKRAAKELAARQRSKHLHQIGVAYGPALAAKLKETGDTYTLYIQCEPDSEVDATTWAASIGFPIPDECITVHDKAWSFEARFVGPNYNIPCEWDFMNEGDQGGAHGELPVGIMAGKNVKFNWKEIIEELLKAGIAWRAPKHRV
jgi:hypothetical protein